MTDKLPSVSVLNKLPMEMQHACRRMHTEHNASAQVKGVSQSEHTQVTAPGWGENTVIPSKNPPHLLPSLPASHGWPPLWFSTAEITSADLNFLWREPYRTWSFVPEWTLCLWNSSWFSMVVHLLFSHCGSLLFLSTLYQRTLGLFPAWAITGVLL